jgi:hypothetical protein
MTSPIGRPIALIRCRRRCKRRCWTCAEPSETAAREVFKSLEGATLGEYARRVR